MSSNGEQRRIVLMALLALTTVAGIIFFWLNMQRGATTLAIAELIAAATSALLLVIVRCTTHLWLWSLCYLIPFLSLMMYALWLPITSPTVFVWTLLIPVICHLLLGRRLGLAFSIGYLLIAGFIFMMRYQSNPVLGEPIAVANFTICALAILVLSYAFEWSREQSAAALMHLASTDPLTGLANRARFNELFAHEHARACRHGTPLSLLLLDLDHFKKINDTYGHEAGDEVLRAIAALLRRRLRTTDQICRLGGEEFAVILPDTDIHAAADVARQLCRSISTIPIHYRDKQLKLTTSIGVASLRRDGDGLDSLCSAADARLYECKARGRNCVSAGLSEQETEPHSKAEPA